jgi:hypothetical protein
MGLNDGTNEDNTSQLAHRSLQIQMFLSDSAIHQFQNLLFWPSPRMIPTEAK